MEIETLAVCGLCFKISAISKYGVPSEALMMLRGHNVEKLNSTQNVDSVCILCEKKVENIFDFKARCLKGEKNRVSSELNQIVDKTLSEVQDECRLCNNIMSSNSGVVLWDVLKENNIIQQFQKFVLKIDLDANDNSLICEPCQTSLCEFSNFLLSCIIGKFEESKETSNIFNKTDTKPIDSSLFCTDYNKNDTLEFSNNDVYNECKIIDTVKKEDFINEDHCYALKITAKSRNGQFESIEEKNNEKVLNASDIVSDVNDITNKDMKEKVASENLELQLKSEEIDIKSELEEFMSEMIEDEETLEPFQKINADGIEMDRCQQSTYQSRITYRYKVRILSSTKSVKLKIHKSQQCSNYKVNVKRTTDVHEILNQMEKHSYQSKNKHYLERHMVTHKNVDEIQVHNYQKCGYQSKNKCYLTQRMLTHKNADVVELHTCQKCTYQCKNKHYLKTHMLTHKKVNKVEKHICLKCTVQSKYKYLTNHMLMHDVEMYKCPHQSKNTI